MILLAVNFGAVFLARDALGYLMPFAAGDLHLSNLAIGLLSSGLALAWAASGFVLTALAVRHVSRVRLLVSLGALTAASTWLAGIAGSFALLLTARIASGVLGGPVLPLSQSVMAVAARQRHRGLQMGVVQSVGSSLLAAVLGPPALVAIAMLMGWRASLTASGLVCCIAAALLWRYLRNPGASGAANVQLPPREREQYSLWRLLGSRNIRVCSLVGVMMIGWLVTGVTFCPLYLARVLHVSAPRLGTMIAVMGAGGLCGGVLIPYLSDRFGRRRALVGGALLGALGPMLIYHLSSSVLGLGFALFLSASAGGTISLFMAVIPSETLPGRSAPAGMGLVQGISESLGGVAIPLLAGLLADRYGLGAALLLMAGCGTVAAAAGSAIQEAGSR